MDPSLLRICDLGDMALSWGEMGARAHTDLSTSSRSRHSSVSLEIWCWAGRVVLSHSGRPKLTEGVHAKLCASLKTNFNANTRT